MVKALITDERPMRPAQQVLRLAFAIAIIAGVLLPLACADAPELGEGRNIFTTPSPGGHLRVLAVDEELTRLAQGGELDLENLPPARRVYYDNGEGAGGGIPYVAVTEFFFTQMDVYYAEVSQGADGDAEVYLQLNDERGRDNSGKLLQLSAETIEAAQLAGGPARMAVVFEDEVLALVTLDGPLTMGGIAIGGLTAEEADAMVANIPDRAYRFPEEGRKSKWEQ